jgi:amidohydrolase
LNSNLAGSPSVANDLLERLLEALTDEMPVAVALRERLHANPELGYKEHNSGSLVRDALGAGKNTTMVSPTGFVARVGPGSRPAVAVRAELDALPIAEETDAPFAAKSGAMHACGHDVHMAALVALFRAARRIEDSLPKRLLALYQPSEEAYPSGAEMIVRDDLLNGATEAIVGAHVHPEVPWGCVSVEPGPVNASCDYLRITIEGAGGHGAYPHRARDPILALCHVVIALQSLVSRRLDPMHPGVFSVGWTRAGSAENVIPEIAEAGGTLRALEPQDRAHLREAALQIVEETACAYGCTARVEVTEGEPAMVNDSALTEAARSLLDRAGFRLAPALRSCGSDDFGFYGRVAPSLMMFVGLEGASDAPDLPLHNSRFLPPPKAVEAVARAQAVAFAAALIEQ